MPSSNSDPIHANGKTNPCHSPHQKPGVAAAYATPASIWLAQAEMARTAAKEMAIRVELRTIFSVPLAKPEPR